MRRQVLIFLISLFLILFTGTKTSTNINAGTVPPPLFIGAGEPMDMPEEPVPEPQEEIPENIEEPTPLDNDTKQIDTSPKDVFIKDGRKTAYLTFDDGPSKKVTPAILDILDKYEVKATFFVIGQMAMSNGDVLKRIIKDGHAVGNHSYSHNYSSVYIDAGSFMNEVRDCESVLKSVLGQDFKTSLFRFPGGSFGRDESYKALLKSNGYEYIDWNALNGDAEGRSVSVSRLIKRVKDTTHGKEDVVILMHDMGGKTTTIQALPQVIEYLKGQGYEFKTLN